MPFRKDGFVSLTDKVMARNIEIKAKTSKPGFVAAVASVISGQQPQRLRQVDTFFDVPLGRLKLRVITDEQAELIYYRRANNLGPKKSSYRRLVIARPKLIEKILCVLLRSRGKVIKDRFVYIVGQTRIHLDHVESLGNFVELEVVLQHEQTDEEGTTAALYLMKELDISESELIEYSYIDLLTTNRQ